MSKELVIPGLDNEDLGTLLNTRDYSQYVEMVGWILSRICKFCTLDKTINKVVNECDEWRTWINPFPSAHTSEHLIIAPTRHITHIKQMSVIDWNSWAMLMSLAVEKLPGGCVATRFGDPKRNAGSVRHLHTNIIVPDGTGRVQVTLAKNPAEIEEKKKLIGVWEKLRTGTPMEKLSAV